MAYGKKNSGGKDKDARSGGSEKTFPIAKKDTMYKYSYEVPKPSPK